MRDVPSQGYSIEKRTVTKPQHPEMTEVKQGDELLVVNFEKDTRDPLNRSLQDRIDALNNGADGDNFDDWDDEDDDDDGGDVVVVRR